MTPHTPTPSSPPHLLATTPRQLFTPARLSVGSIALRSPPPRDRPAAPTARRPPPPRGAPAPPPPPPPTPPIPPRAAHSPAPAKSVIFLFQAGGPSQLELFEEKPKPREFSGKKPPAEFMAGRRFAF